MVVDLSLPSNIRHPVLSSRWLSLLTGKEDEEIIFQRGVMGAGV